MCFIEHIGDFLFLFITVIVKVSIKFFELSLLQILSGIRVNVHRSPLAK